MLHRHVGILESLRLPFRGVEQLGQALGDHHLTGRRAGAADLRPTRQFTFQIGSQGIDVRTGLLEQSRYQPFLLIDQREQQVLKRRILVPARIGVSHRAVQGFFERTGK